MAILTRPVPAPSAACPTCGLDGEGTERTGDDGVHSANYLCPVGHIWLTRWADLGATA